jgi:hypothetical protein
VKEKGRHIPFSSAKDISQGDLEGTRVSFCEIPLVSTKKDERITQHEEIYSKTSFDLLRDSGVCFDDYLCYHALYADLFRGATGTCTITEAGR